MKKPTPAFSSFILSGLGCLLLSLTIRAQIPVDTQQFRKGESAGMTISDHNLGITWDAGGGAEGQINLNLQAGAPLFNSIKIRDRATAFSEIAAHIDPVFLLTVGKRTLKAPTQWIIFFDKPYKRPYTVYRSELQKKDIKVISEGIRTRVVVSTVKAGPFSGKMEITLFGGTPLIKMDAVMSTPEDSTAMVYDAGLVSRTPWDDDLWNNINPWESIRWADPENRLHQLKRMSDPMKSLNLTVKYRTIIGRGKGGDIALFPPPHQYFFPEDNCYNMAFTWCGRNYRNKIPQFGIGIRQKPEGDERFVPWFNAPPGTQQHLSFFCLLNPRDGEQTLEKVKAYTHQDKYLRLPGYYTFSSHYHIEPEIDVLQGKPLPAVGEFVPAFKQTGVDIVHLASFHLGGHPAGPDSIRLKELKTSFDLCRRWSDSSFLLLPGEEPNHFFGGHWISLFPRPVYWTMSEKGGRPFSENNPVYGKVYHIGSKEDMLRLLKEEDGLAWTSHPRIKGSTGYPDRYKDEAFYRSDHFLGAAWKSLPADLSDSVLGKRALDLLGDMANWGQKKYMPGEGDLFKILPEYELYGNMNINYLQLDSLPSFGNGWSSVLKALQKGRFFVTTGEILITDFSVNGRQSGETLQLPRAGDARVACTLQWTFPLDDIKIVSGDGDRVYEKKIDLRSTGAFGKKTFTIPLDLHNRKWVRLEAWDAAVNGAFTQCVWIDEGT
ncbi:hypothetical protein [Compostibacter hankyongensis]|uniref:Uncharacterized protein n=1 Tax=Compostibacter hankyongensis TaxID=1007089 RepID=A0ABP8G1R8_9BACT